MSLYNLVHGRCAQAPLVMALLDPIDVGRFRDAWVEKDEAGNIALAVYTRNGGGNREHYSDDAEAGPSCTCTGCTMTHALPAHPLYILDRDDDFDCTYATVYFRVPEEIPSLVLEALPEELRSREALLERLKEIALPKPDMGARWTDVVEALSKAGPS